MRMIYKIILFLFFISFSSHAQKLEGTVSDNSGTVSGIMVVLKKSSSLDLIYKFTTTDSRGTYAFLLENEQDSLSIQAIGFLTESEIITLFPPQESAKNLIINLVLTEKKIALREVIIKSVRPITISNDTVTYSPGSFKDGSERVIEDLLKKLPGIEVEQSGQILYKGKPIKKFLLDGADLFNEQYVIGSRNIDVNMIAKVQAIDKFDENSLLKGLRDTEDVALNIQLVKGKSDFSGNANLGIGTRDKYEGTVTGLLINSKNKGFVVSGYNNIGKDSSPNNFQSSSAAAMLPTEINFEPKKIINEGNFFSQLDSKYSNFNSNYYTSVNALKKISKKSTLKVNFGFQNDKLKRSTISTSTFLLNNEQLKIENTENLTKQHTLYDANFYLENKKSKNSTWDLSSSVKYKITDFSSTSSNNGLKQDNTIVSYDVFTKQVFNLTKRIDSTSAFKIFGIYTKGRAPQNFKLTPGFNTNATQIDTFIAQNQQESTFDKQILTLRFDYFRTFGLFKWNLSANYSFLQNNLISNLKQSTDNFTEYANLDFQNNTHFSYHLPSMFTSLSREVKKKYAVGLAIRSSFYSFNLDDKLRADRQRNSDFIFAPAFTYVKFISSTSKLKFTYKYNIVAPLEENLFRGIILTDFRNFQNNEPEFNFLNTQNYALEYDYNNILKFSRLLIRVSHDRRKNNYFTKTEVSVENTLNTTFFLPTSRLEYRLDIDAEQFIYALRTYFKFYGTYSLGLDKNMVNNSDLRNVQNRNLNLTLNITPKITNKLQFENKTNYSSNSFYVENVKTNFFQSIENKCAINYSVTERLRLKSTLNFLIPNLSSKENYKFLDSEIEWSAKNNKTKYAVVGHNLFNIERFNAVYVSDFSNTQFSYRLLQRYVLFKMNVYF